MSGILRIVLVVAAIAMVVFVALNVRKSKVRFEDTLPWLGLSLLILLISLAPWIMSALSRVMGFQSPVNLVFLFFIAVLLVVCFRMSLHISELEIKLKELTQQVAVDRLDHHERTAKDEDPNGNTDENPSENANENPGEKS